MIRVLQSNLLNWGVGGDGGGEAREVAGERRIRRGEAGGEAEEVGAVADPGVARRERALGERERVGVGGQN